MPRTKASRSSAKLGLRAIGLFVAAVTAGLLAQTMVGSEVSLHAQQLAQEEKPAQKQGMATGYGAGGATRCSAAADYLRGARKDWSGRL